MNPLSDQKSTAFRFFVVFALERLVSGSKVEIDAEILERYAVSPDELFEYFFLHRIENLLFSSFENLSPVKELYEYIYNEQTRFVLDHQDDLKHFSSLIFIQGFTRSDLFAEQLSVRRRPDIDVYIDSIETPGFIEWLHDEGFRAYGIENGKLRVLTEAETQEFQTQYSWSKKVSLSKALPFPDIARFEIEIDEIVSPLAVIENTVQLLLSVEILEHYMGSHEGTIIREDKEYNPKLGIFQQDATSLLYFGLIRIYLARRRSMLSAIIDLVLLLQDKEFDKLDFSKIERWAVQAHVLKEVTYSLWAIIDLCPNLATRITFGQGIQKDEEWFDWHREFVVGQGFVA